MIGWHSSSCHKKRSPSNVAVDGGNAVGAAEANSGHWQHIGVSVSYWGILGGGSLELPSLVSVIVVECGQECFQARGQTLSCVSSPLDLTPCSRADLLLQNDCIKMLKT